MLLLIGLLMAAISGRVVYLQTIGRERTIHSAERQHNVTEELLARRGGVYAADGTLMACTVLTRSLFIDPKFFADAYTADDRDCADYYKAIAKLAKFIDKKPAELARELTDRYQTRYYKVADNLDDAACDAIARLNLPGVGFTYQSQRNYPMGALAAHVLGGCGKDGHGLDGLEHQCDKELNGINGEKRTLKDAKRRPIAVAAEDYRSPEHGKHLVLTIDANIQLFAEEELRKTCEHFGAAHGEVVVMDPRTGDILAIANYPTFNPQTLEDAPPEDRCNRAIVVPYEPGSTIKPYIAGPALAWGITRPDEIFTLHGAHYTTPYGRHISDVHGYDHLAMWDVLVKSSNIGMSMLGERLGNARIWRALTAFGYGTRTGIDLPGENPGKVSPLKKWTKYSTESCAQGYELMVTPLQLCRGFCAYANGGHLVQPHVVRGMLDDDGHLVSRASVEDLALMPMVLDAKTADLVRRILCDVVLRGTASHCGSKTWNVFGKTGTAHIAEHGHYSETRFNSSFIAGAPFENPRLVVSYIIHDPTKNAHFGGTVAAPGAVALLERSLDYLQVPSSPELAPPPSNIANVLYEFNPSIYHRQQVVARGE